MTAVDTHSVRPHPRPTPHPQSAPTATPVPGRRWAFIAVVVAILFVAAAVATGVEAVSGASPAQLLIPTGGLVGAALLIVGCVNFEWFVLLTLALRAALDITRLQSGAHLVTSAHHVPSAVSSGAAASGLAVLFIVMSTVWLLAQWRHGPSHSLTYAEAAFGGLGVACLLSVPGAVNRLAALTESARIVAALLMFLVLVRLLSDGARIRRVLVACGVGYLAPVALGLLQAAGGGVRFQSGGISRVVGSFLHPNTFAFVLDMFLLMAIALFRHCERRVQWVLAASIVVGSGLLVLTYSRGGWLALFLGLIAVGVLQSRAIFAWMVGGVVVAIGLLPSILSRFSNLSSGTQANGSTDNSLLWRVDYWRTISSLNHNNPVTGIGLKGTRYLADQNKAPHNDFLRAYVETGAVGLLAFLLVLIALGAIAVRGVRTTPPGFSRGVAVGFTGVLIAYVIDSFGDNLMSEVVVLWYFYAAAACAYAATKLQTTTRARG